MVSHSRKNIFSEHFIDDSFDFFGVLAKINLYLKVPFIY
ncbi:hypothetical protein CCP3SC1AL1_520001 [Gammaproteobacteria bacterium]